MLQELYFIQTFINGWMKQHMNFLLPSDFHLLPCTVSSK